MKSVLALTVVLAALLTQPAQAHRYSASSGQSDAQAVARWYCGAFLWTCDGFLFPVTIYADGYHSWSWNDDATHLERRLHVSEVRLRYCGVRGRAQHGQVVESGEKWC